jgi:hypothetical protein
MVLVRCTSCEKRCDGKPFNTTFAWRLTDGRRKAYRAILCMACYVYAVAPLDIDYVDVESLKCPQCGIDTEDDYDAIYITSFIPNYGKRSVESPFCGACAAVKRSWVQAHARELEDGVGATGGPYPDVSGEDVLKSLGIQARQS